MKKKLVSLVLVAAAVFSMCVPAFATTKFKQSVFDEKRDELIISSDDMEGRTTVYPFSCVLGNTLFWLDDSSYISVDPSIYLNDSFDLFKLSFNYVGSNLLGLNGITIKIGDNRYSFANCYTSRSILDNGKYQESISFFMKNETKRLMKDLNEHRDEEIKVRLSGSLQTIDFILTDGMKDCLLDLYNLFDAGGGTRDKNLHDITVLDSVVVARNGEAIDGLLKEKTIDAIIHAIPF